MYNPTSKSIYRSGFAKAALLAAMAFCGATAPAQAQEEVTGKFTLRDDTRLGDRILPPGSYVFTIETASTAQALGAVPAAGTPVVFIVRPEKLAGPVAVVFAMASRREPSLETSKLVLKDARMQSMYLDEQRLMLDFDWTVAKDKAVMSVKNGRQAGISPAKATD